MEKESKLVTIIGNIILVLIIIAIIALFIFAIYNGGNMIAHF